MGEIYQLKKADVSELVEDKYHIFSYYAKNAERNFEIYQIEMESGCNHSSIGHSSNSYEYIMMTQGKISVVVNGCKHELEENDALYFDASLPHCYINNQKLTAKMVLIIQYI